MIMMIMIIMISLKSQFESFTISLLSPTRTLNFPLRIRVQITCNTLCAHHVEYVVCYMLRRDSSAIGFDRVEIAFILALFY